MKIMVNNLNDGLITDIQNLGSKYLVHKIVLFGSRARGDNRSNSDIDLAIFPQPEFNNQGHLSSDIDDLNTLLKLDVVFINENTDIKLIKNIERDGVLLYERPQNQI
jgi:uncharacterized protein